jgi:16S rRNA (uracil1498-N3)-methyltransferase
MISLPLFFIEALPRDDESIILPEETSRHVVMVLRMQKDDELQLTNGRGSLFTAKITDDHKKKCVVTVVSRELRAQNTPRISIAISLLKSSSRFEWFLEKCTEMGIAEIIPLICERTEKQHVRSDRMKNILVSAMLQSQQVWLPELRAPASLQSVVNQTSYSQKLIAHCHEGAKVSMPAAVGETIILIGPEGDFSTDEVNNALAQGYVAVTLGQTRLRAETAGMVAAALLAIKTIS